MLRKCRNELICDFAETYHIYELGSLPLRTVAILADGLRDTSRTKMKLAGVKIAPDLLLLAHAVDRLGLIVWKDTKDGRKNRNRPDSFVEMLKGENKTTRRKVESFDSFEDFEKARKRIITEALKHG